MVGNSRVDGDKKIFQVLSRLNRKELNIASAVKGIFTYSYGFNLIKAWEDKGIVISNGGEFSLSDKGKRIFNLLDNHLQSEILLLWN